MFAHVGTLTVLCLTLVLSATPSATAGAKSKLAPAAKRTQVGSASADLDSSALGARYVRADSRAEALALLLPEFQTARPKPIIEVPSNMSSAKYGPCWLRPHGVHTRKSGSWGTVGAKPETECKVPVSVIRHETTLRYSWYIWWLQAGWAHVETDTNSKWFQSVELEYKCRGKEMTTWTGTTLGTIVFRGHRYYARVYHGVRDLACGA